LVLRRRKNGSLWSLSIPSVQSSSNQTPQVFSCALLFLGQFFKGEELHYEIGVWLFKQVAVGKLSFKEMGEKGRYIATLQGEVYPNRRALFGVNVGK
jgi:hypothetical protein